MLGAKDSFVLERRSTLATRKDGKGRALRKGEHYRKSDGRYSYSYNDVFGNRKFIYSNNLANKKEIKAKKCISPKTNVKPEELKKYKLIIDEINRGEISKIFG